MRYHILITAVIIVFSTLQPQTLADDDSFQFDLSSLPSLLEKFNISAGVLDEFKKFIGVHSGEIIDGLSKVKKYLQHYGYLPNNAKNFTDSFDEMLASAIKSYQQFYNLEQTGRLDTATVGQMILPRCGNPDVGTQHTSNLHTVGHDEFFEGNPRWNKLALTFAFMPENQLSENYKKTIARAFSRWMAVTPLTFTLTESYNNADIKIAFYKREHGDGGAFDGPLGQLAHAFEPPAGLFHFDHEENWVVEGEPTRSRLSAIDLESVAVHEIGHLLGLGHSSDRESVMYATLPTSVKKVELKRHDIAGIQSIYGSNPKFNQSESSSSSPVQTSKGNVIFGGSRAPYVVSFWPLPFLVAFAIVHNIFLR